MDRNPSSRHTKRRRLEHARAADLKFQKQAYYRNTLIREFKELFIFPIVVNKRHYMFIFLRYLQRRPTINRIDSDLDVMKTINLPQRRRRRRLRCDDCSVCEASSVFSVHYVHQPTLRLLGSFRLLTRRLSSCCSIYCGVGGDCCCCCCC